MRKINNKKQGISLIVLVITIIVMVILAATIVITLNNSGIIVKASDAVDQTNLTTIKEIATMGWTEAYLKETTETKNDAYYQKEVMAHLKAQGMTDEQLGKYKITATTTGVEVELLDDSEHGLYYDEAYVADIVEDGVPMTVAYVFHRDGSAEMYAPIVEWNSANGLYIIESEPENSYTYENDILTFNGQSYQVSKDGKTIEQNGQVATLQLGLEHGPYRGYTYQSEADSNGVVYSVTLNTDGTGTSAAKQGETVLATQTAQIAFAEDEHKMTAADGTTMGTFMVSLDGRIVYWQENRTLFNIVGNPERQEKEEIIVTHSGIIPEGGTYYVGVGQTAVADYANATATYTAGQPFPSTINTGDVYVYGDYEYRYNMGFMIFVWIENDYNGWGAIRRNSDQVVYEPVLPEINNEPTTAMSYAYFGCKKLVVSPEIPATVVTMTSAFEGCESLTTAPRLPETLQEMGSIFSGCSNLITYTGSTEENGKFSNYVIPAGVTTMRLAFKSCVSIETSPNWSNATAITDMLSVCEGCTALTTVADIPSGVKDLTFAFAGCTALKIAPSLSKATKVEKLESTFEDCTALTTAPTIPSSVTNIQFTFRNCINLTGTVTINANPQSYTGAFNKTVKSIKLVGSCPTATKEEISMTGTLNTSTYEFNVTY